MLDGESCDGADGYLEVPSCIESLASSAGQLRQLAKQACQYYARTLICYGSAGEPADMTRPPKSDLKASSPSSADASKAERHGPPKGEKEEEGPEDLARLDQDKALLRSMSATVRILPFLDELSSFIERCLVSVESTVKRITYYLNLACERRNTSSVKYDTLQLTPDLRLDTVFVALMDLVIALTSLEKTIRHSTNLVSDLNVFGSVLQKLINGGSESLRALYEDAAEITDKKVQQLDVHIKAIGVALGTSKSAKSDPYILGQCVERLQHLNLALNQDKTQAGLRLFYHIFEEFLVFYCDFLVDVSSQNVDFTRANSKNAKTIAFVLNGTNLVPTCYMNTLTRRIFGAAVLSVIYESLFKGLSDARKIHRALSHAIRRTKPSNIVLLEYNAHLFLDEFLQLNLPKSSIETKTHEQLASSKADLLQTDVNLEFQRLSLAADAWLVKLKKESVDCEHMRLSDWPKRQILILDQGLKLCGEISTTVRSFSAVYRCSSATINPQNLVGLYKLTALLKCIQSDMDSCGLFICNVLTKVEHFVRVRWRHLFAKFQKRQISLKFTDRPMDLKLALTLSSIVVHSELLSSNQGRVVQSLCLSMLLPLLSADELQDLNQLMDLMRYRYDEKCRSHTDCNHLYWHLASIGTFYTHCLEEYGQVASNIHMVHLALVDVEQMFTMANRPLWSRVDLDWLLSERARFLEELSAELLARFGEDYLDRVCHELEVELRLQTHKDLYSGEEPETQNASRNVYDFKQILAKSGAVNFCILGQRVNLHFYVEQYLNRICYELTALAPHDWATYDSMMNMARHKYGLRFVDTQLPAQSLDSGLDLLDITRNLALFAARYSYDLTNQIFVEKCTSRTSVASSVQSITSSSAPASSNQLLNTVQSHHIAESIQTHGYGVLDSAVNATYQALKRLVNVFSRQLSDERLRALLQKEHQRLVHEFAHSQKSDWKLPYERASRIAKQTRLNMSSLSEQAESQPQAQCRVDLDSIRQTVTQIGNLLAFVRLIKNGALVSASRSVNYVPDMEDLSSLRLSKCVEHEFAHYETHRTLLKAAENFDQCLENYRENFLPKTNYIKTIVGLFSELLSKRPEPQSAAEGPEKSCGAPNNAGPDGEQAAKTQPRSRPDHLELFFLLLPALTISHVDHLINCKERAASRSASVRFGALLFDDGFAMGAAFLLTVLGQSGDFGKLDWLARTCLKLRSDMDEVETRVRDPKYEESLRQTSSMTLRRLNKLHSEYAGLEHTMTCATLLFENFSQD